MFRLSQRQCGPLVAAHRTPLRRHLSPGTPCPDVGGMEISSTFAQTPRRHRS